MTKFIKVSGSEIKNKEMEKQYGFVLHRNSNLLRVIMLMIYFRAVVLLYIKMALLSKDSLSKEIDMEKES